MSASEGAIDHFIKLIESNKVEEVKQFVQNTEDDGAELFSTIGKKGFSPLHSAVFCSHSEIISYLLTKEINVNQPLMSTVRKGVDWYEEGSTALHIACSKRHTNIVDDLLSAGASPNVVNSGAAHQTPLHMAAEHGYLSHVERLVLAGASSTAADQSNELPIHKAARNGHSPAVMYLVTNGAEVNPPNNEGLTPLMLSIASGHLKTSLLLLENGADITLADNDQNSPLALAVLNNQEDMIPLLVDNEVDLNLKNAQGNTALHLACSLNQKGTVSLLLEVNVDANAVNNLGQTPLHLAAISNNYEIVGQLISNLVQTNIADQEGKFAVDYTNNELLIAMINTGVVPDMAPARERTILDLDLTSMQQAGDPSTTTNTNAAVYTADDSVVEMKEAYGGSPALHSLPSAENHGDIEANAQPPPAQFHETQAVQQFPEAQPMSQHIETQAVVHHPPAGPQAMPHVAPPTIQHHQGAQAMPQEVRHPGHQKPQKIRHRQPAELQTPHPPSHENRMQQSHHQFPGPPGQFQQPIKVDRATVDTLRQKIKGLESQILTLGIGDDKAVVLYRQYGKLNEEINLARQMVRDYVTQNSRPLTPRMENNHSKSNFSSPMDLPTPRQGASTPRDSKYNGRKFNPNFMVETVESLKSELQILRNNIKPTHVAKLNVYMNQVESMALAVITFAHMMAVTLVL